MVSNLYFQKPAALRDRSVQKPLEDATRRPSGSNEINTLTLCSTLAVIIDPTLWPTLDRTPPTNTQQVQQWINQIDWTKVPNIPVNQLGGCQNASNAQAASNAATNGWWTCGGYTRSSDVVSCPTKNVWGLSYE